MSNRIQPVRRTAAVLLAFGLIASVLPGFAAEPAVELEFDLSLHYWRGELESVGKVSVYRGPLLLTYDRRYNEMDPEEVAALDAASMSCKTIAPSHWIPPLLLLESTAADGRALRLCEVASVGSGQSVSLVARSEGRERHAVLQGEPAAHWPRMSSLPTPKIKP